MHSRDTAETALNLIPEIARACGMENEEIQALYDECAQYDDTQILLYLLSLLSFTEHGYLTTPHLQNKFPELGDEIKLAKISLDALTKMHLLHQASDITASLKRIESKVDNLTSQVNTLQSRETKKKPGWLRKKNDSKTSKCGLFSKKRNSMRDSKQTSGYASLRKTQLIPK